ncbi:Uncharacterised protein [Chlamydia abortus]|nr:Uncharacterised protein [Chlamydia abortus]SGA26306.1 Uncharacterised protein [Chlamydia abortus]
MRYGFVLVGVRGRKGVAGVAPGQPGDVTAQMTSPGARVLSQCIAMTTPGPPQGQLAAGSRRLICELCCPQPLAVPCA